MVQDQVSYVNFLSEFLNLHHQRSLFKHISPFLLTHEEWKEIQNEIKKYWKFSLSLLINIKNVDFFFFFFNSGIKILQIFPYYFDFERLMSRKISQVEAISIFLNILIF